MKTAKLSEMIGGWFVGDFNPTLVRTKDFEVAVKYYKKGDLEKKHVHRIATEITVVVTGRVRMFDREFAQGEIILLEPNDPTAFEALEDSITAVVKFPSVMNDKFILD